MVMKKNAMRRNLRQSIVKSIGRYIAITAIIILGAGLFLGLVMTKADMIATGQKFIDEQNMFDLRMVSNYGWSEDFVEEFAALPGVEAAEGQVYMDMIARVGAVEDSVYRFYSIPQTINKLALRGGRMPEAVNECLADGYLNDESIIGQQVVLSDGNEEDSLESVTQKSFTVVGIVSTPLYMDMNRGTTSVGSGVLKNYFFVPEDAFDVDYYTEINLTLEGNYAIYSKAYSNALDAAVDTLEPDAEALAQRRFDDLKAEIEEEYDEGYQEYLDGLKEYKEGKAEAEQELADAEAELKDGEKKLEDARIQLINGGREIEEGYKKLEEGKALLGSLGGEGGGEHLQKIRHGIRGEYHRILACGRRLTAQLADGTLGSLRRQSGGIQSVQISQLDLVVIGLFLAVGDHRRHHKAAGAVLIVQIQALGIVDGKAAALADALGGAAVDDGLVRGIQRLLGGQHLADQLLSGGQRIALNFQRLIALAALAQKYRVAAFQHRRIVRGTLHHRGSLLGIEGLGGGVAHLAAHDAAEAHAALDGAGKLVGLMQISADGGRLRSLIVKLIFRDAHFGTLGNNRFLETVKIHIYDLLIFRLR